MWASLEDSLVLIVTDSVMQNILKTQRQYFRLGVKMVSK